jgi:hypothetical protein
VTRVEPSSSLWNAGLLDVAVHCGPGDALLRVLLGDLGVELPLDPADLHLPVVAGVGDLGDGLHTLHELRERLELGPLVIRRPDRNVDVDGLGHLAHGIPPYVGDRGPFQGTLRCVDSPAQPRHSTLLSFHQ